MLAVLENELSRPDSPVARVADKKQALFSSTRIAGDVYSTWIFGELKREPNPIEALRIAKVFVFQTMTGLPPEQMAAAPRILPPRLRKLSFATGKADKSDPLVINMEDNDWKIVDSKFKPHQKELDLYARTLLKVWRGDLSGLSKRGFEKDTLDAMAPIVTMNRWLAECLTDLIASFESSDYAKFIIKLKKYGNKPNVLTNFLVQLFDNMAKMEKEGG